MKNKLPIANGRLPVEKPEGFRRLFQIVNRKSKIVNGFTLVELLVVISIIAVLAAFTVPVLSAVKRHQYISQTQAEMGQLEAAIGSYHDAYGIYPPDNPNNYAINQLYFELLGTTYTNGAFTTLDGSASITTVSLPVTFNNLTGFVNCSRGSGEDAKPARSFISNLRPNQYATNGVSPATALFFVASVGGPDATYSPPGVSGVNPWRYNSSSPTNNPGSYDLWVQLSIAGKKYLICNWSKEAQINNPLP